MVLFLIGFAAVSLSAGVLIGVVGMMLAEEDDPVRSFNRMRSTMRRGL